MNLLDLRAIKYHRVGIPLFQLEVVSMEKIHQPEERFPVEPKELDQVPEINIWSWRAKIIKAYKKNSFEGVVSQGLYSGPIFLFDSHFRAGGRCTV